MSDSNGSVADTLPRAVSAVARWFDRASMRQLDRGAMPTLSPTELWLLDRIASSESFRMSDLARWHAVDRSTMTSHVRGLERRGLIERRSDDRDRRLVLVAATSAGRNALQASRAAASAILEDLISDWPADDRADLVRVFEKLAASVDARQTTSTSEA